MVESFPEQRREVEGPDLDEFPTALINTPILGLTNKLSIISPVPSQVQRYVYQDL